MTSKTPREWLWELTAVESDSEVRVSDDVLRAYRAGALEDAEARRVEAQLGRSADARARLAALAGTRIEPAPARVRRRIFGPAKSRRSWLPFLTAAALAAVLVVPIARFMIGREASMLPADLEYEVRIEALADVRSVADTSRALPDTRVRIVIEPNRDASARLEYGLYRRTPEGLERLTPGAGLDLETHRGSVVFTTRADSLVDAEPGDHEFVIAVAPEGTLPSTVADGPSRPASDVLRELSEGLVYRRTLTVVDPLEER
jgi:hypothetical protein